MQAGRDFAWVVIALVTLAACTDPAPETDLDRFNALLAKTPISCGGYSLPNSDYCGLPDAAADRLLTCMNDALATGARAAASVSNLDSRWFYYSEYMFTVDHEVQLFDYYAEATDHTNGPSATEGATCAGPFRLVEPLGPFHPCTGYKVLVVDACSR